jgi:BirA family biotin operon repressor/biotin-[acetyl-CoA-carboxylase] ligase
MNEGFAPLRSAWLARAARLGEPVTARLPGREIGGRFETIDESGALELVTPQGRVSLPAAEIHFAQSGSGGEVPHAARN